MSPSRHTRWFALFVTSALLLIWGAGLAHSIWGGLNPGYMRHAATRPYPVRAVSSLVVSSPLSLRHSSQSYVGLAYLVLELFRVVPLTYVSAMRMKTLCYLFLLALLFCTSGCI